MEQKDLKIGSTVVVHGLIRHLELNGTMGVIVKFTKDANCIVRETEDANCTVCELITGSERQLCRNNLSLMQEEDLKLKAGRRVMVSGESEK